MNKLLERPLALTAGILGLIQGIVWTVFAVLSICCYNNAIKIYVSDETNATNIPYYEGIYYIFLNSDGSLADNGAIIEPQEFYIFMWFYLAFSVIWGGVSGAIAWAMIHRQWQLTKCLFGAWSGITILVSIVDIILTSLIARDYAAINTSATPTIVLVCYGIVMSVAARGYILWVVNIIFAGIIMRFAIAAVLNESKDSALPIIHGYETSDANSPPWFSSGSMKDFWENSIDSPDAKPNEEYDNHGFQRNQSFFPPTVPNNNIYEPPPPGRYHTGPQSFTPKNFEPPKPPKPDYQSFNPPPISNYPKNLERQQNSAPNFDQMSFSEEIAHRTATIGKNKGRRSPLRHVAGPVIPPPDYTPPGSPHGLKSVLRAKSNYNQ